MNLLRGMLVFFCVSLLTACGGGDGQVVTSSSQPVNTLPDEPNVDGLPTLQSIYAYQSSSIGEQAVSCAKQFWNYQSCYLDDISPIGIESGNSVSLDEIKERLVVSHDWMAESFIEGLEEINDTDLQNLFKPVNSIVISYEVIPSFYHLYTGSIYIDPRYLWRNGSEWDTIYQLDDYRSDFGSELQFIDAMRYVDQYTSDYVTWSNYYDATYYYQRSAEQIAPGLFSLLSHELAHANDYLNADTIDYLIGHHGEFAGDSVSTVYNYIGWTGLLNEQLALYQPLSSRLLSAIAQVTYGGESANSELQTLSGAYVGEEFADDGAASLYSYYHDAEDVAMLFEAFMMYKKYGAVSDVAFVSLPEQATSCDDYIVQWGQRNRLADSYVKDRAIFIANEILQRDVSEDLAEIDADIIQMQAGSGWCESQFMTSDARETLFQSSAAYDFEQPSVADKTVVHDYLDDFMKHQ